MRASRRWIGLGLLLLAPGGCGGDASEDGTRGTGGDRGAPSRAPLLVLAASDLARAFEELIPAYEAETGHSVDVVLGSTGNLAAQLRHGAPADVFFAADERFLDDLVERRRIDPESRALYAVGRMVLVAPPGRSPPGTLAELTDRRFQVVAIANPEHAPYGRAAREALERAGVWEQVAPRLVFGENIQHTLQFVETGNADAAIVALSLVERDGEARLPYTLVDAGYHEPLLQAAGVGLDSPRAPEGRALLEFVLSPRGQWLLARFGFEPPPAVRGPGEEAGE